MVGEKVLRQFSKKTRLTFQRLRGNRFSENEDDGKNSDPGPRSNLLVRLDIAHDHKTYISVPKDPVVKSCVCTVGSYPKS